MVAGRKISRFRRTGAVSCLVLFIAATIVGQPQSRAHAQDEPRGRFYPQTGQTLAPQFVGFFDANGGIPVLGYPVTEARVENGYLVQWTERQRLEWHPENAGTSYEVLLGLLGSELTHGFNGPIFRSSSAGASVGNQGLSTGQDPPQANHYFPQTGQYVSDLFYNYWLANGGVTVFGYPISAECDMSDSDCGIPPDPTVAQSPSSPIRPTSVQWFERARFEVHPENPPETRVLLGQLGREALSNDETVSYRFDLYDTPAPDTKLQIGLSQGGESSDPTFFDNIRQPASELGPGLVRLDNIFNFYSVVQRDSSGKITYNWTQLDTVLDSIQAMGKEPFICLSYTPDALSQTSAPDAGRVLPPASYVEWSDMISATVTHINVDRKAHGGTPVRYWEVWNEPDQWSFWQAPYPEYLTLYDVTARAALAADPSVSIGGPSVSYFSPDHLRVFLQHEADCALPNAQCGIPSPSMANPPEGTPGTITHTPTATPTPTRTPTPGPNSYKGRVDFISWHSYGKSADEIAANIRNMRTILQDYPQFSPQIFITEFNVLQGGPNDTSANGYTDKVEGAIAFLSSIESMQRERLDRALLFELKDGPPPECALPSALPGVAGSPDCGTVANPRISTSYWGRWGIFTYDGLPKPVYYALKAYQNRPPGMLPVTLSGGAGLSQGPGTEPLGMMAFGSPQRATFFLWYPGLPSGTGLPARVPGDDQGAPGTAPATSGPDSHASLARVKIALPSNFDDTIFDVALFDHNTNNPAHSGNVVQGGAGQPAMLTMQPPRSAGDLVFELQPDSLVILTTRTED